MTINTIVEARRSQVHASGYVNVRCIMCGQKRMNLMDPVHDILQCMACGKLQLVVWKK